MFLNELNFANVTCTCGCVCSCVCVCLCLRAWYLKGFEFAQKRLQFRRDFVEFGIGNKGEQQIHMPAEREHIFD